ncbi:MAG: HAD family hydrolase [Dehalococcoidales bacterium]
MIKAVFFDLYNTLITYDPPREDTHIRLLKDRGIIITRKAIAPAIKAGDEFFYRENSRLLIKERSPEEQQKFWYEYEMTILNKAGISGLATEEVFGLLKELQKVKYEMAPFSDVLPAFSALKNSGYKLGIISNIDRDINPMCEKMGLSPYLDIVLTSHQTGLYKPSPQIFHLACEKTGVTPAQAVYIGDQYQIDVVGANRSGMTGVLLDRNELSDANQQAEHLLQSLIDAPRLVSEISSV